MTTDVINGVPRSLLREILRQAEQNGNDTMATRALGDLLATAQPAADGERGQFEAWFAEELKRMAPTAGVMMHGVKEIYWHGWQARAAQPQQAVAGQSALSRAVYLCSESGPRFELTIGFASLAELQAAHDQVSHAMAATQPAQPEPTDEVRRLREALDKIAAIAVRERQWRYEEHNERTDAAFIGGAEVNLGLDALRAEIDAALSAHKTGEEE